MFNVRPGITGYAQVNGRRTVEWHKRIELNVWYVEHLSMWLDIKVFFKTILKVFKNADNENLGETVEKKDAVASEPSCEAEPATSENSTMAEEKELVIK